MLRNLRVVKWLVNVKMQLDRFKQFDLLLPFQMNYCYRLVNLVCPDFQFSFTRHCSYTEIICSFMSLPSARQGNIFRSVCQEFSPHWVSASVHAGIHHPQADTPHLGRHPLGRHPPGRHPPPADGYCGGRYASYWKAFLFNFGLTLFIPLQSHRCRLFSK